MTARRTIVNLAVLALLVVGSGAPMAIAATSDAPTDVFEREVLQTKLSPTGELVQSRLYSQLTVDGDGPATVVDPTSAKNLRNLHAFSKPAMDGDVATWNIDGDESLRTVADYDGEQPVEVTATYTMDGEAIEPDDLVGRTGVLTTTYTVKNVSTQPTDVEFRDAYGARQTETVDLPLPLAGQLETTLSKNFTDVVSEGAVLAGDGRGNTKLKWTLILFEPLGALEQTLTVTSQVTDAELPPTTVQVVPVVIEQAPLSSGNEAYTDAAAATYELTQGATTIDRNLLRLATGAGALLDGLVKLADGAAALRAGLGDAATGSGQLADGLVEADNGGADLGAGLILLSDGSIELAAGMSKARAGGAELAAGLGRLGDGAQALSDGLASADAGGEKLADGLDQLEDGSAQLADGLDTANAGGIQLADGAVAAQAGAAKAAKGAADIEAGMRQLEAGLLALADDPAKLPALIAGIEQYRLQALGGIAAAIGTSTSTFPGGPGGSTIPSARAINAQVKAGLDAGSANLFAAATEARSKGADLQALADGQILTVEGVMAGLGCPAGSPPLCAALDTLIQPAGANLVTLNNTKAGGLELATTKADELDAGGTALATAAAGMAGQEQILAGVHGSVSPGGSADQGLDALIAGVNQVRDGVRTDAAGGAAQIAGFQGDLADGLEILAGKDGLQKLVAGMESLSDGLNQLDAGGEQLADGAGEAAAGGSALSDGLNQLSDGSVELADGAGTAADGSGELVDGLSQLEAGSQKLADGNGEAAAGGAKLSDGLGQLRDGGQQLADGLVTAEDGSGQIADGLGMAKIGGGQVADGAAQLNEQGTSPLAAAVNDSNAEQNRNVALVRAMDERSRTDGMPAGAPEGATSSAVYSFELAGATGAGQQNALRLGLTGAALAVMVGAGMLRRRVLGL